MLTLRKSFIALTVIRGESGYSEVIHSDINRVIAVLVLLIDCLDRAVVIGVNKFVASVRLISCDNFLHLELFTIELFIYTFANARFEIGVKRVIVFGSGFTETLNAFVYFFLLILSEFITFVKSFVVENEIFLESFNGGVLNIFGKLYLVAFFICAVVLLIRRD